VAWIDSHFWCVIVLAILAGGIGVLIDWERVGQYPAIGTSASNDPTDPIGLRYLLYLPSGYHYSPRRWPLVLFLHGAGSVGHDLRKVKNEGLALRAEEKRAFPFVLVAPQCGFKRWSPSTLDILLGQIIARYRIDANRVYLTGLSMGGYGTWSLASEHPERFAAIAPICGGGNPALADRLRNLPIWVFHGAKDDIVGLGESQKMVDALKAVRGDVKFTVYPNAGHDSWTPTYSNPNFYAWLLSHSRPTKP
jgi:predicted peptidase